MAVGLGMDPNSFWSGLATAAVIGVSFHVVWRCFLDDRDKFTIAPNEILRLELDRDQLDEECRLTSLYMTEGESSHLTSSLSLSSSGGGAGAEIDGKSADLEMVTVEVRERTDTEGSLNPLQISESGEGGSGSGRRITPQEESRLEV